MTVKKLKSNLEKLHALIPTKPEKYTPDFPINISEAFHKYLRARTVSLISINAVGYEEHGYPIPLFVNLKNQKVGAINTLIAKAWKMNLDKPNFSWISIPPLSKLYQKDYPFIFTTSYIELFNSNILGIKKYFLRHHLFKENTLQINDIVNAYKKGYWAACICTTFPLLDLIIRKTFKTHRLEKDITYIVSIFKQAGFGFEEIDNLKPNRAMQKAIFKLDYSLEGIKKISEDPLGREKRLEELKKIDALADTSINYGLIGIALSSFLHYAYHYYAWYRNDKVETNTLNRHAIIHGASNEYYTQANCVKLLAFLYLTLEIEPVLSIVLNEE